jgi:myosin protein heavy chain
MQKSIFGLLAAILHLSNLAFGASTSNSQAYLTDLVALESAGRLLGLPSPALREGLLNPVTKAGTESFRQSRSKEQVVAEVAALCRAVYERCFGRIVDGINEGLAGDTELSGDERFIGVLDIAGFEVVEKNGFEQLCECAFDFLFILARTTLIGKETTGINYTNERLQQLFNEHMFLLEQAEYLREQIDWEPVDFGLDLQPTIDLIESTSPTGILSIVDEASMCVPGSEKIGLL